MNPIITTSTIKNEYLGYLESLLTVRDSDINLKAKNAIRQAEFVKGPYLEATPPFFAGSSLSDLIIQGMISPEFREISSAIHIDRPLYAHQEQAIRKVINEHRNIIVSTGTGSGKTECYLYPILNELMLEKEAGKLNAGVRALLLFPMNALANDQLKRLRQLLSGYPDITFGRYTGETIDDKVKARQKYIEKYKEEPLENELLSRNEMRATPPNILLTNYAMLEYLLLRPNDSELFDDEGGKTWKFIILDEAHSYKGSNGSEIAFLLRRLKDRICDNQKGKIQCIATSATLGDMSKLGELAEFASNIFDENFAKEDIILSKRIYREAVESMRTFKPEEYVELKEAVKDKDEEAAGKLTYDLLITDARIIKVQDALKLNPRKLEEVADDVFDDLDTAIERRGALVNLIELGSMAKEDRDSAALLPARYHLFVKSLEGMFASLYPEKNIFLDRRELWSIGSKNVPVFELSNCQDCGQEYIVGIEKNGCLVHPNDNEKMNYYMLSGQYAANDNLETDEDDEVFEAANVSKTEEFILCTACGKVTSKSYRKRDDCCSTVDSNKLVKVFKLISSARETNTCAMCGSISASKIKRFMTANHPATFVVANSLYNMVPPQGIEITENKGLAENPFGLHTDLVNEEYANECGRKLLVFSDNRQEAAFFGGYMDNKYNQLMWRRLIIRELKEYKDAIRLDDLISRVILKADNADLYQLDDGEQLSSDQKAIIASQYIIKEFLAHDKHTGLEGRGYLEFFPQKPNAIMAKWGLDPEIFWNNMRFFMDTLRYSNAISYPDNVNPEDDSFAPRNRFVYFRKEGSGNEGSKQILGFIPSDNRRNKRIAIVQKILESQGSKQEEVKAKAVERITEAYGFIEQLVQAGYFKRTQLTVAGSVYSINYKKWYVKYIPDEQILYRCKRCGKMMPYKLGDFCCEMKCSGTLEEITAFDFREDPYYHMLYTTDKLIPMVAKEHTAQLKKDRAGDLQEEFEKGLVNVLSCSTTFEMGVDVGQLEAIFLRNVPPETANYIQRAGRAGRRTSSTAFAVTFARRNSHDLNYFREPQGIISGKIKAPYIEISNEKIAFRHLNSIVFSWLFKKYPDYFLEGTKELVGDGNGEEVSIIIRERLSSKPEELNKSINNVFSAELMEKLGTNDWSYLDTLAGSNGKLTKAIENRKSEIDGLREIYIALRDSDKLVSAKQVKELLTTYRDEQSISFLASNGVLPKYGFPIDVVKLDIQDNSQTAKGIDISRDLKMAISEFAPGSSVVAGGKIWKSHSINKVKDKDWPTYRYFECPSCKAIAPPPVGFEIGVLDLKEEGDAKPEKICRCGTYMNEKKFIVPIFGFSTAFDEKSTKIGETRPKKDFATRVQYWGVDKLDPFQEAERKSKNFKVADKEIQAVYSPNGKLVVLNRGTNGSGLFICRTCGYAQAWPSKSAQESKHNNKFGRSCGNRFFSNASLGHYFFSDILRLEIPDRDLIAEQVSEGSKYSSLLYALLEGASEALGIARADISGCIDFEGSQPALILFDEATGGAGHVKRIFNNLELVLQVALKRVNGDCGCGPETSCYGCLRNYNNQFEHEVLVRGMAKEYLEWILSDFKGSRIQTNNEDQKRTEDFDRSYIDININSGWKEALKILNTPATLLSYQMALELIQNGVVVSPDEIGYELASEDFGVMGFEAEMIWQAKNVALIMQDETEGAVDAFEKQGWKVFEIGVHTAAQISETLRV